MEPLFNMPKWPRYRVSHGWFGLQWRTATDKDLIVNGDNPANYLPYFPEVKKEKPKLSKFIILCLVGEILNFLLQLYNLFYPQP